MSALIDTLRWQFRMSWSLAHEHWLPALSDELLLWQQTLNAAAMRKGLDDRWTPDWDEEPDPVPPATAGWLTWHITWWWTSISASMDGAPIPDRASIAWQPSVAAIREELERLAGAWTRRLASVTDDELERPFTFPWPEPRPARFGVAWVNGELMKNAAELGDVVRLFNGHRSRHP